MSTSPANSKASTVSNDETSLPAATTSVVSNNNASPFKRRSTPRPRVFNDAGVQTIKGGSPIGAGFFDAVTSAYTNLVNSPFALVLIVFTTFIFFTLASDTSTPIVLTYNSLLNTSMNEDNPTSIRSVATLFTYIFQFLVEYEFYVAVIGFLSGIYMAKPSTNNAYLCSVLALILMLAKFSPFEALVLCHLTLIYTQVRDPTYRLIISVLAVVIVIFGYTHISSMTGLADMKTIQVKNQKLHTGSQFTPNLPPSVVDNHIPAHSENNSMDNNINPAQVHPTVPPLQPTTKPVHKPVHHRNVKIHNDNN